MTRSPELKHPRGAAGLWSAAPLSAYALVVVNLVPVLAVLAGWMSTGDVFVVYWLENVAVWLVTAVKVATARGPVPASTRVRINGRPAEQVPAVALALFFSFHYGIFTLVHGAFAFVLAAGAGGGSGVRNWLLSGVAFLLSHLVSLLLNWFGQDERSQVSPQAAMGQPYPRMLVLHVAIIGGFFLLASSAGGLDQGSAIGPVLLLCGLKTAVDLWFHLRERQRARGIVDPVPGAASS
ncbi:DUF6498-containing protein [Nocardioides houyundeii]|uniref:DUF6498-containing protein n=1 Tax=Nocardioides houyundeii TaxID=2045452 RepID=UPI000C773C04|nr:DUF6498-containing protein [Nocardioides houyundeii]